MNVVWAGGAVVKGRGALNYSFLIGEEGGGRGWELRKKTNPEGLLRVIEERRRRITDGVSHRVAR